VHRILSGRPKLKYYEAGMDLGLSYDRAESFRLFQARILEEYDRWWTPTISVVLDGTIPVNKLQKQMRDIVASKIDLETLRASRGRGGIAMPEQEKKGENSSGLQPRPRRQHLFPCPAPRRRRPPTKKPRNIFTAKALVGFDPSEITGSLIVIEGMDGSGRSTQIALLQEWLESEGFAVQTSGLRRSNLVGRRHR